MYEDALMTKPCGIMIGGMCVCLHEHIVIFQKDRMISDIFISDIVIARHPVSVCVPVNHKVILSVRAESACSLQYQWFTDDEGAVCEVCDTISKSLTDFCTVEKTCERKCAIHAPYICLFWYTAA